MIQVRTLTVLAACVCAAGVLPGATLERLTMDDMVQKSTDIVRGRILGNSASFRGTPGRGGMIYTHYTLQVTERWKGSASTTLDVAVPGGFAHGLRQTFAGAPELSPTADYVLFLWRSPSGLTQILGLSQGLLTVKVEASGASTVGRNGAGEPMIDKNGLPVADPGFNMSMDEFRATMSRFGLGVRK